MFFTKFANTLAIHLCIYELNNKYVHASIIVSIELHVCLRLYSECSSESARSFFLCVIRWTGKAIAGGLSEIEQSPVRTGMATRDGFWVLVHVFVGNAISTKVFRVIVLQSPLWRTCQSGRELQYCCHHWNVAHSTWDIVIKYRTKRTSRFVYLILSSIRVVYIIACPRLIV